LKTQRPVGAIVLAAGLGTRMNSARAKVLHHLAGRPLISYPLAALRTAGVDPIVVVVGYQAEAVMAACAPYGVRVAVQAEQRGTGHATQAAQAALGDFSGDLLLVYGDLPFVRPDTFRRLVTAQQQASASVSLLTATVDDPTGFGRVVRDAGGRVTRIVEERDASEAQRAIREINVGVYCADASFLFRALQQLQPANAQRELYLTDIVELALVQGLRVADTQAAAGEGAQISSRVDLAEREKTVQEQINSKWMAAGVTFEDPWTAYVGPDVVIGRDTIIGPNVILRGVTRVGQRCRFDGSALIVDTTIGDNVHVKFGVVMTEATLADDVQVGPFAQLRPGTRLGKEVHIGDFVETKNAAIGARTKANHHAYLGDTEIGQDTNIGAGTITCNYDGFRKYRTIIGDRVQVGSDSQFVAPIRVGDDAYIATGTTVRKDVPPGALVFNSKDQQLREAWVAGRRAREAGGGEPPVGSEKAGASRRAIRTSAGRSEKPRVGKKAAAARRTLPGPRRPAARRKRPSAGR
jgi:bifunctional UDP-N-acetylglucosamine pyrophosphorylase/glucosamine-1-phosphate N-acetyltransferase